MESIQSLNVAIIRVKAQLPRDAVRSDDLRLIAKYPCIADVVGQTVALVANGTAPHVPSRLDVEDMCLVKIVELIQECRVAPTIDELAVAVKRSLRSRVTAEYTRLWEDRPAVSSEARRYMEDQRTAKAKGVEPTDAAHATAFNKPAEEIRADRCAYGLSRMRSFNGDWVVKGPEGFAVAVRRGHKDKQSGGDDRCGEALDCESLCDLYDRYGG